MSDTKKLVGEILHEILDAAKSGGPRTSVGLLSRGSELGPEEMIRGGLLAQQENPEIRVVMIGPKPADAPDLAWIETEDCEKDIADAMEQALKEKTHRRGCGAALSLSHRGHHHRSGTYPRQGKAHDPRLHHGDELLPPGGEHGAQCPLWGGHRQSHGDPGSHRGDSQRGGGSAGLFRALNSLKEAGIPPHLRLPAFAKTEVPYSRGNDILGGAVDVCVADSLTGNVLMKMFASYSTGGGYEALGWGYGPSCGG